MRNTCDEELFVCNSASGGSSENDDDEARAMFVEISGIESMMRQAHDALAELLLKSGTGDVQKSSPSPCNLRCTGDGTPEDAHSERRRPLSSARCRARPATTATVAAVGVKPKSPSGSVDRPRRRIPGALWSLSKTKRISNYGLPAMASPLRGQSRKRNGNTPPSQQPRQINDLLHDASTSDPALMTCKRPEPGFNADRAGESNDCGTFSVDDDQESQKVEGQQVVRRVSGDGDDDGQVGPSKDIRGFESLIDDARRTENKGNGTRSCRSCHHKTRGIETDGSNAGWMKDNVGERGCSPNGARETTAVDGAQRSAHVKGGDADKGGDRKTGQVSSVPKEADSGKSNDGPCCTTSCWSGCSCPCHERTPETPHAPIAVDNNNSGSCSKISDRTTLVNSSGAASANRTSQDIIGGTEPIPRYSSGKGERPIENTSPCVGANSLQRSRERRSTTTVAEEPANSTAANLETQPALGNSLAIAATSKQNAPSTDGKARAGSSSKNGVVCDRGRRKARNNNPTSWRGRGQRRTESGRQRENEGGGSEGDVHRAFLATSECRGRPRRIHFGSATRRFSIGGMFRVGEARDAQGQGAGVEEGRSQGYDLRAGEAMVRPRLKGFHLSRRARDPELARVESVAAAAKAIGRRMRDSTPAASQPAGGDVRGMDVIKEGTGDPTRVHSETPSALCQESGEIGGEDQRDPRSLITKTTDSCPTAAVKNRDEDAYGKASAVSMSIGSKDALGAEEEEKTTLVVKATASTTTHKAEKSLKTVTATARCGSVCDTTMPAQALDRCSKSGDARNRALPAADPCDAVLSHQSRVRSVVFPRPHAHQARRASRRRGEISVSPGPGQYEVGLGGFGRKNMSGRAPMLAPLRHSLKAKARVVVEARKAKMTCLRGPGDYDITRAEGITRMRTPGVVSMRPPTEYPGNASRREQEEEVIDRRKTNKPMSKKCPVDTGKRHSRSGPYFGTQQRKAKGREAKRRCRDHGRGRSRNRSQPRGRTFEGEIDIPERSERSSWSPSSSSLSRGEGGKVDARGSPCNRGRSGGAGNSLSRRRRRPHRQREKEEWKCRSSSRGSYDNDEKEEHKEECVRDFSWDDEGDSTRSSRRNFNAKFCRDETSRSRGRPRVLGATRHCRRPYPFRYSSWAASLSPLNFGRRRSRARSTKSCYRTADDNRCLGFHVRTSRSASRRCSATYAKKRADDGPSSQSDSCEFSSSCVSAKWRSRRNSHRNDSGSTAIESVDSRYEARGNCSRNGGERVHLCNGRDHRRKRRLHHLRRSLIYSAPCDQSGERSSRIMKGRRRQVEGSPLLWSSSVTSSVSSSSRRSKRCLMNGKPRLKFRSHRDSSSSDTDGKRLSQDNGADQYSRVGDNVWRGFLAISRKVPAWKFAPPEGKGVGRKNRLAVERARRQRERERTVGFHDVRWSLTEEKTPCMASFAAQAEARSKERDRLKRRKPRTRAMNTNNGQAIASCGQPEEYTDGSRRAWASEGHTLEQKQGVASLIGCSIKEDPTKRRRPTFRYIEERPLPLQAARRLAEREATDHRRHCWLDVNVHKSWVNASRVSGADVGSCGRAGVRVSEFGKTTGREKVKVNKKGQRIITPFNHVPRATDHMGPGRYETEDIARATRRGRLGDAPVPRMALAVSREEAVGPRGERRLLDHSSEDEEGDILILDVKDDFITRRRRVPGGVLPSAPRWTEQVNNGGNRVAGSPHEDGEAALDVYPTAGGGDQVGPRRDKGHRYIRFEKQTGRGDDIARSLTAAIVTPLGVKDDVDLTEPGAAEGDVLRLNPREAWGGWRGGLVEMEKQADRWTEYRGPGSKPEDGGEGGGDGDDDGCGDVLLLEPNHNAVRRKLTGAPAFEKQLGRREWQAQEEEGIFPEESNVHQFQGENGYLSTAGRLAPASNATRVSVGREIEDPLERADRGWRPRSIMLVNIDRQQQRRQRDPVEITADDEFPPPSPTTGFHYKDAQYDTARGIELTKSRVGRGAVDMSRNQGRGMRGGITRQGHFCHYFSDGDIDGAGNAQQHAAAVGSEGVAGDELMLSPRWSALAVRPSGVVEWHRSAGKSCSLDAHGEVFGEFGDLIGSDHLEGNTVEWTNTHRVELARTSISRGRSSAAKTFQSFCMSQDHRGTGECETSPRVPSLNVTTTPTAKRPPRMELAKPQPKKHTLTTPSSSSWMKI